MLQSYLLLPAVLLPCDTTCKVECFSFTFDSCESVCTALPFSPRAPCHSALPVTVISVTAPSVPLLLTGSQGLVCGISSRYVAIVRASPTRPNPKGAFQTRGIRGRAPHKKSFALGDLPCPSTNSPGNQFLVRPKPGISISLFL